MMALEACRYCTGVAFEVRAGELELRLPEALADVGDGEGDGVWTGRGSGIGRAPPRGDWARAPRPTSSKTAKGSLVDRIPDRGLVLVLLLISFLRGMNGSGIQSMAYASLGD